MKKTIILSAVTAVVLSGSVYLYTRYRAAEPSLLVEKEGGFVVQETNTAEITNSAMTTSNNQSFCLKENEVAEYALQQSETKDELSKVTVTVKSIIDDSTSRSFSTDIFDPGLYHPIELYTCGVYFLRGENYDPRDGRVLKGFRSALWKFDYNGKGEELLPHKYYTRDFRVSPDEKYTVLVDSYNGILDIKNNETKDSALTVKVSDIRAQNQNIHGSLGLVNWTADGRYFWADLFEEAYEVAWIRVDTNDWSYGVYEAPEGILGGYPLDINTGWVPVVPGAFWTGSADDTDIIRDERDQTGWTTSSLYLYNVITKEKLRVHTENDPVWDGWPIKWLDQNTLQYTLPDKTKETFTLPN